jgi:hypothetical protein
MDIELSPLFRGYQSKSFVSNEREAKKVVSLTALSCPLRSLALTALLFFISLSSLSSWRIRSAIMFWEKSPMGIGGLIIWRGGGGLTWRFSAAFEEFIFGGGEKERM